MLSDVRFTPKADICSALTHGHFVKAAVNRGNRHLDAANNLSPDHVRFEL